MSERKKSENRRRGNALLIRLDDGELAHLGERANALRMTPQALLRALAVEVEVKPPRFATEETERAFIRQLSGIGTNLNQLARIANTQYLSDSVDTDVFERTLKECEALWQLLNTFQQ